MSEEPRVEAMITEKTYRGRPHSNDGILHINIARVLPACTHVMSVAFVNMSGIVGFIEYAETWQLEERCHSHMVDACLREASQCRVGEVTALTAQLNGRIDLSSNR